MTGWTMDFLPRDGQLFPRTVGEIFAGLLRARWPHHTAKQVERTYDIDPATAKNLAKGHASERTITRILQGEGEDVFELLDALGQALTGQTRHEWEEKKLQRIIEEANRAEQRIRTLRTRRELLAQESRPLDEDLSWPASRAEWRASN